jgi:hypothetical protein
VKPERLLEELEGAAARLGVRISYEALTGDGMSSGGLCKVRGEWRVIVERRAQPGERAAIVARALSRLDLDAVFLSPEAREAVERHRAPGPSDPPDR